MVYCNGFRSVCGSGTEEIRKKVARATVIKRAPYNEVEGVREATVEVSKLQEKIHGPFVITE